MTSRFSAQNLSALLIFALATALIPDPTSARMLELVEQHVNTAIGSTSWLRFSPDGQFVHLGSTYATQAHFRRDRATGRLSFVRGSERGGPPVFSPNGRSAYSIRYGELSTFTRSPESGELSLFEKWHLPPIFGGHGSFSSIHFSPDGAHVYAHVRASKDGIAVFDHDPETGALSWIGATFDSDEFRFTGQSLAFSPDGRHVYGYVDDYDGQGILIYSRNVETGALTLEHTYSESGIDLLDLQRLIISPNGSQVYVLAPAGIIVLQRNPEDGTLSFLQILNHVDPAAVIPGPENRLMYIFQGSSAHVYSRATGTGSWVSAELYELPIDGLNQIHRGEMSPDGRHLYLGASYEGEAYGGLEVLARDPESGALTVIEAYRGDVEGDPDRIHDPQVALVSPDGRHLYLGVEDDELELAVFSRSPETGRISYLDSFTNWLDEAEDRSTNLLAFSPEGRTLYTYSRSKGDRKVVAAHARDAVSGELTLVDSVPVDDSIGLNTITDMVVSPDGRSFYATGTPRSALAIFLRNPLTGTLTHFKTLSDLPGRSAYGKLGLDAEGDYLYMSGGYPENLLSFARHHATGDLTLLEAYEVPDQSSTSNIELSPDGRHLYMISAYSISTLDRNIADGRLALVTQQPGASGLFHISPDGRYAFSFGYPNQVYRRDPSTGLLALIESADPEKTPSNSVSALALSPSGDFAYVGLGAYLFDAVNVYRIDDGLCRASWDGLCLGGDRFRAELEWRDFEGNTGTAQPLLDNVGDSGVFWFFDADNWEMQLKVLDACDLNERFWVFAASTTEVEFTLRLTDVVTGVTKTYFNPLGNSAGAITDTDAFDVCSDPGAVAEGSNPSSFVDLSDSNPTNSLPLDRNAYQRAPGPSLEKFHRPGYLKGLGGKCLEVAGGLPVEGSPVMLNECHGGASQRWQIGLYCSLYCNSWVHIRFGEDQCLRPSPETDGPDDNPGLPRLELGYCDDEGDDYGNDKQWEMRGPTYFGFALARFNNDNLCADVLDSNTANGTPVVLRDCDGGDNQQWVFDELACPSTPTGACKNDDRFLVEVDWRDLDGNSGKGRLSAQESDDSGLFWFFSPDNLEMLVKVLDGCDLNQHFWVSAAATTNVEYTLRVTDTLTREVREYSNPLGNVAPALTDTSAFLCAVP